MNKKIQKENAIKVELDNLRFQKVLKNIDNN